MKLFRKTSGLILLTILVTSLSAQNTDCYFRKTFPTNKGTSLTLSNKYGDVNIITVKDDSLTVCASITIEQNDKELIQKSIKLVSIRIEKLKDSISVSTAYDKKFFSEIYRLGRKSFSVDYTIRTPAYLDVNITNAFGNVSIEELSGTVNVRLSQGIFSAKKLTKGNVRPVSSIDIDHGNISINDLNWMAVTARICPSITIQKAQALLMNSDFSKIRIGEISSLVSDSKYDSYSIESITNLVSESFYSSFEINILSGKIKSAATYGSITISDLNKEFSSIDIISSFTPIMIKTGDGMSFKSDILVTDALADLPVKDYPGVIKTESRNTISYIGIAGDDILTKSMIRIRTTSGNLQIINK
jgi:hypothetical protein